MKARAHVWVEGCVQGVFFRYETSKVARNFNVNGWVRNLPDGRVEAVFEGEKENVEEMVEFCRRGPPGAQVNDVEAKWEAYRGEFSGFEIKYR
ncbi:MAG: acylphosphatase [Hadesarchaea archaeon CG08_land_8_20_14_0_20_51_8]|nr:MAG: acylphosphatase [Hadesarchaea archaeon CG08_land_8_20_14_0_20_51_8]